MAVLISLFMTLVQGEFRAFQLIIENTETGQRRMVKTRFDHLQYQTYNQVGFNEVVRYQDSWMCFGRTSGKPICPNPNRDPSSEFYGPNQ